MHLATYRPLGCPSLSSLDCPSISASIWLYFSSSIWSFDSLVTYAHFPRGYSCLLFGLDFHSLVSFVVSLPHLLMFDPSCRPIVRAPKLPSLLLIIFDLVLRLIFMIDFRLVMIDFIPLALHFSFTFYCLHSLGPLLIPSAHFSY